MKKDKQDPCEWDGHLIVGTYYDEINIKSYKIDILRTFD